MNRITPLVILFAFAITARAAFHEHLGLQTWSVRELTKAKGFEAALDQIKDWGFKEIEGTVIMPDMTPEQVRAAIESRGLVMPGATVRYDDLKNDLPRIIHHARVLGLKYVICPGIPRTKDLDRETIRQAAALFNEAGKAFRAVDIKFGYHPHGYESIPGSAAGETLLDELIIATRPEDVAYEMDVFWMIHGGWDPVKMLQKYPGRWMALHVKDIRKGAPTGFHTGRAPAADNVAVGSGAVDWKAMISAAERAGIEYYFIEDETADPMSNVPVSLAYLKALKL